MENIVVSLSFRFQDISSSGSNSVHSMQVCTEPKVILSTDDIVSLIGNKCDGVIGQVGADPCVILVILCPWLQFLHANGHYLGTSWK